MVALWCNKKPVRRQKGVAVGRVRLMCCLVGPGVANLIDLIDVVGDVIA